MTNIVIIGCGEVGLCYAKAFVDAGFTIRAMIDEHPSSTLSEFAQAAGSSVLQAPDSKMADADLVVSCVFGGVALEVFKKSAPWMRKGAFYADFTTADPDDMRKAHQHARMHGIQFVDVAIMGAISASRSSTPLICAGEDCSLVLSVMQQCASPIRQVGTKPGEAATLKLLRSIFTKGLEALSIECLMAAEEKGLRPQLYDVLSDIDQMSLKDFMELSVRTHVIHAKRRLKEVQEAKKLMKSLALNPLVLDGVEYFFGRTSDQFHTIPTSEKTLESSLSWLGSISKSTQSNPTGRSA